MTYILAPWMNVATPTYSWAYEFLSTDIDAALTKDESHGTVVWDSGGFARFTYTTAGVTALQYTVPTGNSQILVQYDIRRNNSNSTKQLKIFSRGDNAYPDAVTGPFASSYSGTLLRFTYSDNSNGGDNDCELDFTGTFRGGTSPTRTPAFTKSTSQPSDTTVQQDISGSVWETWAVWYKANSNNTADGELAVWKNGTLVMFLTNMWNAATTGSDGTNPGVPAGDLPLYRERGRISLADYANVGGGWTEDYRNWKIGFNRPAGI